MTQAIILASGSQTRQALLANAGVPFETVIPRVDEKMVKESLVAEGLSPRDIADALAEEKARRISLKKPGDIVIGCDQVLDFNNEIISKPETKSEVRSQLDLLCGKTHSLYSAAVICEDGKPVWRHIGRVRLTMHRPSERYLDDYVERNWDSIRHSVGGYRLEEEGARLFARIEGDYFTTLGLPLLELLSYLALRGALQR